MDAWTYFICGAVIVNIGQHLTRSPAVPALVYANDDLARNSNGPETKRPSMINSLRKINGPGIPWTEFRMMTIIIQLVTTNNILVNVPSVCAMLWLFKNALMQGG